MTQRQTDEAAFLGAMLAALSGPGAPLTAEGVTLEGAAAATGSEWASVFAVSALAAASVAAAGLALRRFARIEGAATVDRRLASLWFKGSIVPEGWATPPSWAPLSGDYAAADGFIRLHCNAAAHAAAAQRVLGGAARVADKAAAAREVARWSAAELEAAVVAAGGAAARMRTQADWTQSAEGAALCAEPLVRWDVLGEGPGAIGAADPARPLAGVKVLDMTRVLAGPTATRFLAGFGAEVLRIDPPFWDEPSLEPEMTLGKRCAGLDLRAEADRAVFDALLARADLLVCGLRPGALAGLGVDAAGVRALNPALPIVQLSAYGWSEAPGAWAGRRGFDSLVQMSAGIAAHGQAAAGADAPVPLPVQALDYATGYLVAAAALQALSIRSSTGRVLSAQLSLARMAALLQTRARPERQGGRLEISEADLAPALEATAWGPARRLRPPVRIGPAEMRWAAPAGPIRSAPAAWSAL